MIISFLNYLIKTNRRVLTLKRRDLAKLPARARIRHDYNLFTGT